jgi:arginine/ornithine N-succinyltransferase beta subunit
LRPGLCTTLRLCNNIVNSSALVAVYVNTQTLYNVFHKAVRQLRKTRYFKVAQRSHNKGEKIVCVTFQNGNFARASVRNMF